MSKQSTLGATMALSKAGLTGISGAATTYSTGSAGITFAIDGRAYSKAQAAGAATPTTDTATASAISITDEQATVVVWAVDSSGTVRLFGGTVVDLDGEGAYNVYPEFPNVDPALYCPFAYSVHKASGLSGTFTVGSSNWNTTGITNTVVDVVALPRRPQVD